MPIEPISRQSAITLLSQYGRTNDFVARGPNTPLPAQVDMFMRGHDFVRLQTTDWETMTREQLHSILPAAFDLDGTSLNTSYGHGTIQGFALYFLSHIYPDTLFGKKLPKPEINITFYTAWRVGLIDYLLGVCTAINGPYPIITFGWSRRPAEVSLDDLALRAIFLGPAYDIEDPIRRAKQKFPQLKDSPLREAIIDEIEMDLRKSRSFMTTQDLEPATLSTLAQIQATLHGKNKEGMDAEARSRALHLFDRPFKDCILPGGYTINVGGKSPEWAKAADKDLVATTLTMRGLADDDVNKNVVPFAKTGRAIHVPGQAFLTRWPKADPIGILRNESISNAFITGLFLDIVEAPYSSEQGGMTLEVPEKPSLTTYPDVNVPNYRQKIAEALIGNSSAQFPTEKDTDELKFLAHHFIDQYFGVLWNSERWIINFLRHGMLPEDTSNGAWKTSLYSGLELGIATVLGQQIHSPHIPHPLELLAPALFAVGGFLEEKIFGRRVFGKPLSLGAGTFGLMLGSLTLIQALHPDMEVSSGANAQAAAFFAASQWVMQRMLIPVMILHFGQEAIRALEDSDTDDTTAARKKYQQGQQAAVAMSFMITTLYFTLLNSFMNRS